MAEKNNQKFVNDGTFYLIRTTCSYRDGTGHFRRSLTIAKEIEKAGKNVFIIVDDNDLSREISDRDDIVYFVPEGILIPEIYLENIHRTSFLILDLPELNPLKTSSAGPKDLLKIINQYDSEKVAVVSLGHVNSVSPSYRAVIDLYPGKSVHSANYVNGPEYVILKSEFQQQPKKNNDINGILVTMGGSDPFDLTHTVLLSLIESGINDSITVVLGNGYDPKMRKQIEALVSKNNIDVKLVHSTNNMRQLIRECRWGIVAFGTTAFECMSQNTPIITFSHYEWQETSALYFHDLGCCLYGGCAESGINDAHLADKFSRFNEDNDKQLQISEKASSIIDGKGVERIVMYLEELEEGQKEAKLDDLFILAHPGDEIFGCGGTILKKIKTGSKVGIVFLGEGYSARLEEYSTNVETSSAGQTMNSAVQKMMDSLGVNTWYNFQYKDNRFNLHDSLEIVKLIEKLIERHQPSHVYTHMSTDLNIDHRITFDATQTACRPQVHSPVKQLFGIEVPSSSDWMIQEKSTKFNWVEDISETLDEKLKLLNIYNSELREDPHPRSIDGIKERARHFGRIYGLNAAEVFVLHRNIETHNR